MVQCEMCGTETGSPKTVKIEGAELEVCDDCAEFGTKIQTEEPSSTSTKYSTSASSSSSSSSTSASTDTSGASTGGGSRSDMFDKMEEVAPDYDERIRNARESRGLTQKELADQLNEKASVIRKLERGDVLPSDDIKRKLEKGLDIELTVGGSEEDSEWSGGSSTGGTTLGDVVKRKD